MSKQLEQLLGKDQWKLLQKKGKTLEELHYAVVCETCGSTFFDSTLSAVQDMMLKDQWDPKLPQMWFVHAARHWIPQKFHSIRVHVTDQHGDKSLIKDLSAEWTAQMPQQKRLIKKGMTFDQALGNELDYLEQQIARRSHSTD